MLFNDRFNNGEEQRVDGQIYWQRTVNGASIYENSDVLKFLTYDINEYGYLESGLDNKADFINRPIVVRVEIKDIDDTSKEKLMIILASDNGINASESVEIIFENGDCLFKVYKNGGYSISRVLYSDKVEPDEIVLYINETNYELSAYWKGNAAHKTTISGSHGISSSDWSAADEKVNLIIYKEQTAENSVPLRTDIDRISTYEGIIWKEMYVPVTEEAIVKDTFHDDNIPSKTDNISNYWIASASGGGAIKEENGKLKLSYEYSGSIPRTYFCSSLSDDFNFFKERKTIHARGLEFNDNWTDGYLKFIIGSEVSTSPNDGFMVYISPSKNINIYSIIDGTQTYLDSHQNISEYPAGIDIFLTDTNYKVKIYYKNSATIEKAGEHSITSSAWNGDPDDACLYIYGKRDSNDGYVNLDAIYVYNGELYSDNKSFFDYTCTYKYMDWSSASNSGKSLGNYNESGINWGNDITSFSCTVYDGNNSGEIVIADEALSFNLDDIGTTQYYYIKNYKRVILKNIAVRSLNTKPTKDVIRIQNCNEVYIENAYLEGKIGWIRVLNCEYVLVQNTEGKGYPYDTETSKIRPAVDIQGGYLSEPFYTKRAIVQNCYMHDALDTNVNLNGDGGAIQLVSGGDSLLFNCYFEDIYQQGHFTGIDCGHRANPVDDPNYNGNNVLRIEKNIFNNCQKLKLVSVGATADQKILFCNNKLESSSINSYGSGANYIFTNNTFINGSKRSVIYASALDTNYCGYIAHYESYNNLFDIDTSIRVYGNTVLEGGPDLREFLFPDYNVNNGLYRYFYDYNNPTRNHDTLSDWQNSSVAEGGDNDDNINSNSLYASSSTTDIRTLSSSSLARDQGTGIVVDKGCDMQLRIISDFVGNSRSSSAISCGAFEHE